MISAGLIMVAAMLNAVMDTHSHHYYTSIFHSSKLYKHKFFRKDGWRNKYVNVQTLERKKLMGVNIHPAFLDVWHTAKSLMIVSLCLAVVLYERQFSMLIDFVIAGTVWNLTFSLFYNKLLRY